MAVQVVSLRNGDTVATQKGTWTVQGGGSLGANIGDNNAATSIKSNKPCQIKHPNHDISPLPSGALIDYVQLHIAIATNPTAKLHYAAWVEVSGKEYSDTAGHTGHPGDVWTGVSSGERTVFGAKHPTAPQNLGVWTEALVNGLFVRQQVYSDSDVEVTIRESMVDIYYYRKPTCSITGISGPNSLASGRKITIALAGDAGQTQFELWLVTDGQAAAGWQPGDDGALWHHLGGSGTVITLPDIADDGTYVVFARAGFKLPQSGKSMWSDYVNSSFTVLRNPTAPNLLSPADGASIDVAQGFTAEWQFTDPSPSGTQSAWAFYRKNGAGDESYWDASLPDWSDTIVWNAGADQSVFFDPDVWPDGDTYTWKVKTKNQTGSASAWSGIRTIVGNSPPTVQVLSPAGDISSTSTPAVVLQYADDEDDPQDQVLVKVFEETVFLDPGFNPDTSPYVWSTGALATNTDDFVVGVPLMNHQAYRCYAKVHNIGSWSEWAFSDFTIQATGPAPPTLTVTPDDGNSRVKILMQGHDNIASAQDSDFEDTDADVGNWTATNATLALTDDEAASGNVCMEVTATAAAVTLRMSSTGSIYMPVVPLQRYTLLVSLKAKAATDKTNAFVTLRFRDASKAYIPGFDGVSATAMTDDGAWKVYKATAIAPLNARFANAHVDFPATAAGKKQRVDEAGILFGDTDVWGQGGFAGLTTFYLERSDDDGATWAPIRDGETITPDSNQRAHVYDYEALPQKQTQYRGRAYVDQGS